MSLSNMYHTAETLEPGETTLMFSAPEPMKVQKACATLRGRRVCGGPKSPEPSIFGGGSSGSFHDGRDSGWAMPPLTFGVRHGVLDGLDLGVQVTALAARLDVKVRFFDSEYVALASDPTFEIADPLQSGGLLVVGDLPLLAALKVGDTVRLYTGLHGLVGHWKDVAFGEGTLDVTSGGVAVNAGLSLELEHVWIRPEYRFTSYLGDLSDPDDAEPGDATELSLTWHSFGIGFGFRI